MPKKPTIDGGQIVLRVPAALKTRLSETARRKGLNLSGFVRMKLIEAIELDGMDEERRRQTQELLNISRKQAAEVLDD